jgi:hypothetical protein
MNPTKSSEVVEVMARKITENFTDIPPELAPLVAVTAIAALSAAGYEIRKADQWDGHDSDCATHNMPAYPNGPCNCTKSEAVTDSCGCVFCDLDLVAHARPAWDVGAEFYHKTLHGPVLCTKSRAANKEGL